jgi:hypothetical protein
MLDEAIRDAAAADEIEKNLVCIGCFCTWDRPCPGGCTWVAFCAGSEVGICSSCAARPIEELLKMEAAHA